jgi:hypothetical protein
MITEVNTWRVALLQNRSSEMGYDRIIFAQLGNFIANN